MKLALNSMKYGWLMNTQVFCSISRTDNIIQYDIFNTIEEVWLSIIGLNVPTVVRWIVTVTTIT